MDECPECGQRVADYELGGYESESGQRGHWACNKGPLTREQRVAIGQQLLDYAGLDENYQAGGWDVLYECNTAESVARLVWSDAEDDHILTFEQARDELAEGVIAVWADREADARNSAF
jgi:hypothetical protein